MIVRSAERGFTIIEMVVALVLFAIAMAAVLPALGNMLDMGNRGAANAQASADSSYALQLAEGDLRRAIANRSSGEFEATGLSVVAALTSMSTNTHDIISAGPTRLQLWSDALGTSAGPELVTYELREQTTRNAAGPCDRQSRTSWCVLRTVRTAGGASTIEVVAHGSGTFPLDSSCIPTTGATAPAPAKRLFCYQHKVPASAGSLNTRYSWAGWNSGCVASWNAPPAPAGNWNTTNVGLGAAIPTFHDRVRSNRSSISALDTITAIGIVLPAGGRTEGARGLATRVTTVDLRNRASEEYLSAIMCGDR